MTLGETILVCFFAGALLSIYVHCYALVPALAFILFAHSVKGVIELHFLPAALSAAAALITLELGFFLGVIAHSFLLDAKRPAMAAAGQRDRTTQRSEAALDRQSARRRKTLSIGALRVARHRRRLKERGHGVLVARHSRPLTTAH